MRRRFGVCRISAVKPEAFAGAGFSYSSTRFGMSVPLKSFGFCHSTFVL